MSVTNMMFMVAFKDLEDEEGTCVKMAEELATLAEKHGEPITVTGGLVDMLDEPPPGFADPPAGSGPVVPTL